MSTATIHYGGSEMIDQLPVSSQSLQAIDYARIAPLLDETADLIRPLQHYAIAMALFVVLSLGVVDRVIVGYAPSLAQVGIVLVAVKAVIFGIVLYIIDHFLARKN